MRLIVHAGFHKSGSTSIQAYLNFYRAAMAESGIIYPDFGAANHWRLAVELIMQHRHLADPPPGYLRELAARDGVGGTIEAFTELLRMHRDRDTIILLSHENFGTQAQAKPLVDLARAAVPDLDVTLLAYCREPAGLYASIVQHLVGSRKPLPRIDRWRHAHLGRVRRLRDELGGDLKVRGFSPDVLPGGSVIADFRQWFESETGRSLPPAATEIKLNVALSAQAGAFLMTLAADPSSPLNHYPDLLKRLRKFDATYPDRIRARMPEAISRGLRLRHRAEWNQAVRAFDQPKITRRKLRIPEDPGASRALADSAIRDWLLSASDPEYDQAFISTLDPAKRGTGREQRRGGAPSPANL